MPRAQIYFSGHVQGVGFRYMTQRLASGLGLSGWVKNLANGGVEAVIEGEQAKIEELLRQVKEQFGGYIKDCQVSFHDSQNEFKSFEIKF